MKLNYLKPAFAPAPAPRGPPPSAVRAPSTASWSSQMLAEEKVVRAREQLLRMRAELEGVLATLA